jgi:hypothetical protein
MSFDPCNRLLKIWKSIETQTPKVGANLGVWGSFRHTLLHSWEHEMWLLGSLLPHTFASPCLSCESKARVVITRIVCKIWWRHRPRRRSSNSKKRFRLLCTRRMKLLEKKIRIRLLVTCPYSKKLQHDVKWIQALVDMLTTMEPYLFKHKLKESWEYLDAKYYSKDQK